VRAEISDAGPRILGKKGGGESTLQEALPAGPPGMADELVVAGGGNHWHWDWSDGELLASLPPLPEFPESNGIVRIDVRPILYICA
jgi:hypothetical protein